MNHVKPTNAQQNGSLPKHGQSGFTLIELSIVLVIIGLIVGGVLVGQDLIRAAEIRATISQVEKFNTGVNTFRTRFNGIPGDLPATTADASGLRDLTPGQGLGDGNGLIEDNQAVPANTARGEMLLFWNHLSQASLIDGGYGRAAGAALADASGGLVTATAAAATATAATVNQVIPPAKLGRGQFFITQSGSGFNYYAMLPITAIADDATGVYTVGVNGLPSAIASQMDIKIDDGFPNSGTVLATTIARPGIAPNPVTTAASAAGSVAPSAANNGCTAPLTGGTAAAADPYVLGTTAGGLGCGMIFRMQ